jgi:ABC-type transport system substrate-binding protein
VALLAKKNTEYWRDGLPYLDEVEFRPIADNRTRIDALASGQLDMLHASDSSTVGTLRERAEAGELQLVEDRGEGEEGFVMLNMSKPPLDDVRVRQAIAHATDQETYNQVVDDDIPTIAKGPFKADSPWAVETDYPEFDLAEATRLIEEYEAEVGPVAFSLGTTENPETREAVQVLQGMWQQAGMDVSITTVDQANFIGEALAGNYDANLWRQFGAPDPDVDMVWWAWKTADGEDNFLNFARLFDERVDEALNRGRQSTDLEERRQAYADFQDLLSELVPYVWLNHSTWTVAADNDVRGITNGPLPDGSESLPIGGTGTFGGTHRLTQTWLDR